MTIKKGVQNVMTCPYTFTNWKVNIATYTGIIDLWCRGEDNMWNTQLMS